MKTTQTIKNKKFLRILAIETSCDETSAAIAEIKNLSSNNLDINIISNIVSSQIKLHAKYGGVFPELASREHVKNILPVIEECLNSQAIKKTNLFDSIDYIAVTQGPGLIGSLLVGVEAAKTLSFVFNKPLIPVHHVAGHIYANFINSLPDSSNIYPQFPLIALVVSGGHTSLIYMKNHFHFEVIGETLDDAAGEAYDKVASMLGLSYPGGPVIDNIASKYKSSKADKTIKQTANLFPRPLLNQNNFNFSFSGLKTSVLYFLKKQNKPFKKSLVSQVCFEFQEAVTDVLIIKTLKAAKKYHVSSIIVCGGVSANRRLRDKFQEKVTRYNKKNNINIYLHFPARSLSTDNAAMIAAAASYQILAGKTHTWYNINANANQSLSSMH